jgi:hypothetical protein
MPRSILPILPGACLKIYLSLPSRVLPDCKQINLILPAAQSLFWSSPPSFFSGLLRECVVSSYTGQVSAKEPHIAPESVSHGPLARFLISSGILGQSTKRNPQIDVFMATRYEDRVCESADVGDQISLVLFPEQYDGCCCMAAQFSLTSLPPFITALCGTTGAVCFFCFSKFSREQLP